MRRSLLLTAVVCGLAMAVAPGCAVWRESSKLAAEPPPSERREQRREEVVRDFENRRNKAQLEAAMNRWEQGDALGCEQALRMIVDRDPGNVDARLALADVYWAHEAWDLAEEQLRAGLTSAPDRADAHHSLGLLLETRGNPAESLEHLRRASELDPKNELFRQVAEQAAAAANSTRR